GPNSGGSNTSVFEKLYRPKILVFWLCTQVTLPSALSRLKRAVLLPVQLFRPFAVENSCAARGCNSLTMYCAAGSMRFGQITFSTPLHEICCLFAPCASPVAGS